MHRVNPSLQNGCLVMWFGCLASFHLIASLFQISVQTSLFSFCQYLNQFLAMLLGLFGERLLTQLILISPESMGVTGKNSIDFDGLCIMLCNGFNVFCWQTGTLQGSCLLS